MSASATLTIPSGTVSTTLTNFVVRVDLADLPDNVWLVFDGDNLRVRQSGTDIPFDVVAVDVATKTGELYFKASSLASGSDNVFTIEAVDGATPPADTDSNGRNAVWTDYTFVTSFYDMVDRTGNGRDPVIVGTVAGEFGAATTVSSNDHWSQGVAYDGTNWYSTATNEIRKYNGSFTGSVTKSDPIGDAGLTAAGVNHVGDPVVANTGSSNELFVAMETYPNDPYDNQWIAVFNLSDLSFNRKYDISGNDHECSSITFDGTYFYITDFTDPAHLHKYDTSFNYVAELTWPTPIDSAQGVTWKSGFFYVMSGPHVGTSYLWKVASDMSSATKVYSGGAGLEGVQLVGNDLYFCSPAGTDHLVKLTYVGTTGEVGWLTLAAAGNAEVANLPKHTNWTMGATVKIAASSLSANGGILSYSDNSSSNSNRASLLARDNGSSDQWAMWNSSDTFTNGAGSTLSAGDVGARRRLHHVQNGTTSRILYLQGSANATDTGASQRPAGGSDGTMKLFIGAEDTSYSERFNGKIGGIVYLRNGVLAAAWIAAEHASWEGSSFYSMIATPVEATAAGDVPTLTGSVALSITADLTVDGLVPALTGDVTVTTPGLELTVAGIVPDFTGSASFDQPGIVLDGQVAALTGDVTLDAPPLSAYAALVEALDPIAWYRFNDGAADLDGHPAMLTDSSGNGQHGSYIGASTPIAGLVAGVAAERAARIATPTISAPGAVVPYPLALDDDSANYSIVLWHQGTAVSPTELLTRAADPEDFIVRRAANGNIITGWTDRDGLSRALSYEPGTALGPGRLMVVLVIKDIDEAGGADLYINGIRRAFTALGRSIVDSADDLHIHVTPNIGATSDYDELAFFAKALTDEDVEALWLAGSATDVVVDGAVPPLTGDVAVFVPPNSDLTADGAVPALTGDVTIDVAPAVTVDGAVPDLTGAVTVELVPISLVTVDGVVPPLTGSVDIRPPQAVEVDGQVTALTGDVDVHGSDSMTAAGEVPALTGEVDLDVPPQTDLSNQAYGRARDGAGIVFYEPPVVEPPEFTIAQHAFVSAAAYGAVTMIGAQPTFTATRKTTKRARDRILVGGVDVTYFRGVATPPPSYGLVVPLLYGSGRLTLPQVAAAFEHPGHGDLAFAKLGAAVLVQRVDPDDNTVIETDYIGLVVAHDISGRNLVLELGGEATGRAAMVDKQPPLFFKRNDLGFWWWGALQELGLRFEPRLGPTTGIRLRNAGGMDHLAYIQDLSAKGTRRDETQLTCMPDRRSEGGAYRVVAKDLETIRGTVYLDDAVSVPDVRDDMAEKPNRVYATGVTPESMRVKFGAYPMLRDTAPPDYPMADGSPFGIGTTDADTDTGDGVSVMIWRLVKAGYLALADKPGGYDADVADAIRDLKVDALSGPTLVNGDMTEQAWAALFDVSATGYSLAGTQILPAAQRSATRKWNRTANGSVIGRNEDYDPTVIPVDATIDTGVGMTRRQIRGFARGELAPVADGHYVGTITLHSGAVIDGEHNPGDPLTEGDLLDARALRPLENLWAPLFAGGTLFPITGIERQPSDAGDVFVLDVDTRARDSLKVWEVIARNRESRRSPARAWLNQHRSSSLTKDAVGEFDEIGGVLDDRVDLVGGAWTVFPLVAGQEGTIRTVDLQTGPPTEFVLAVFGRQITPADLTTAIGNPLTKGGKKRWANPTIRERLDKDKVLLYAVGEKRNPCGYYPGAKHPADDPLLVDDSADDATEGPDTVILTGRWKDDASFPYRCFDGPVLWVAIWAAEDTHLVPGRVMWPQLEAGS